MGWSVPGPLLQGGQAGTRRAPLGNVSGPRQRPGLRLPPPTDSGLPRSLPSTPPPTSVWTSARAGGRLPLHCSRKTLSLHPAATLTPLSPARGTLLRDATQDPPSVPPSSRRGPIAATPQSRKLAVQLGRPTLPVCPETLATLATGQTPGEGQALTRRRCGKAGEPQEFWRGLCSQPTGQPSRSLSEHWPPVSPGVTSVRSGEAQSETSGGGTGVGVCHSLPQQNLIQAPSVGDAPAPGHSPGPRGPMDLGGRSREGLSTPLHPLPQGKRGLPSSKNS